MLIKKIKGKKESKDMGDTPVKPTGSGTTAVPAKVSDEGKAPATGTTPLSTPVDAAQPGAGEYVSPGSKEDQAKAVANQPAGMVTSPSQPTRKVVATEAEALRFLKGTFNGRMLSLYQSEMRDGRELDGGVPVRVTIDLATGRATNVEILPDEGHKLYNGRSLLSPNSPGYAAIATKMASTLKNSTVWNPMPAWKGMAPQGSYIYEFTQIF
ncbi:MAG: hypothetical protein HY541_00640 [Deltaproteobacteria bacterium]|nr:hypothetical protein [Deltaproteobacteria bacterium]